MLIFIVMLLRLSSVIVLVLMGVLMLRFDSMRMLLCLLFRFSFCVEVIMLLEM